LTRILTFSPYASWRAHTNYEVTITRACKLRGAEVEHLVCDSALGECDIYWFVAVPGGKTPHLCSLCRQSQERAMQEGGLLYSWLNDYVSPEEREAMLAWSNSVPDEALVEAQYGGWPVGEWAVSSVVSTFRVVPIDFSSALVRRVFRSYLFGLALTVTAWGRMLDAKKPDAVIIFNARMAFPRAAFHLARARGIRVLVHERPLSEGTMVVMENHSCISPQPFQQFWGRWRDVPLNRRQMEVAARWVSERRYGGAQMYITFANAPSGDDVKARFGVEEGQKLLSLFTSSTDEYAGDEELKGPFESQEAWIEQVIEWVQSRPDCVLVIRVHPSLAGKGETNEATIQAEFYRQLALRLPPRVHVVLPEDELSSYDLVDHSDVGLAFCSTVGLEMLALGKPVVAVPPLPNYQRVNGVFLIEDPATLSEKLASAVETKLTREFQRAAFRCIYRLYFGMQVPFPLVKWESRHESRVLYTSPDELQEGKHEGLDRICGFLLRGEEIFPPPTPEQQAFSASEEELFLDELARTEWPALAPLEQQALQKQNEGSKLKDTLRSNARKWLPSPLVLAVGKVLMWRRARRFSRL